MAGQKRHKVIVLAVFYRYIEADSLEEASVMACKRLRDACDSAGMSPDIVVPVPGTEAERVERLAVTFYDLCGF